MRVVILGHLLAIGIGLSLGLIGGGGSILAVPILVYVMGIESQAAIAMSLFIVGSVSLLGVIPYVRRGQLSWKIVVGFTPLAMLGAYVGSQLVRLPFITDTLQLVSFGLVMLAASVLMILEGTGSGSKLNYELRSKPSKRDRSGFFHYLPSGMAIPLQGLGIGIVTGFVGVGGGFLIIPALVLFSRVPMKTAVGTSLLIIACNSAAGFAGYLNQIPINWPLTISFTLAAGLSTVFGSLLSRSIEASKLQKGFGYFVLAVAVFVLIQR